MSATYIVLVSHQLCEAATNDGAACFASRITRCMALALQVRHQSACGVVSSNKMHGISATCHAMCCVVASVLIARTLFAHVVLARFLFARVSRMLVTHVFHARKVRFREISGGGLNGTKRRRSQVPCAICHAGVHEKGVEVVRLREFRDGSLNGKSAGDVKFLVQSAMAEFMKKALKL